MAPKYPTSDGVAVRANIISLLRGDQSVYDRYCRECLAQALNPCGLTAEERLAVWVYSATDDDWYRRINGELWAAAEGGATTTEVQFFEEVLNQGLEKLPRHLDQVYRGYTPANFDAFLRKYDGDGIVLPYPGFTSTSWVRAKAFPGSVLFVIQSLNGRRLSHYAAKPAEDEVLFKSRSTFRVRALERRGAFAVIELEEVDHD